MKSPKFAFTPLLYPPQSRLNTAPRITDYTLESVSVTVVYTQEPSQGILGFSDLNFRFLFLIRIL